MVRGLARLLSVLVAGLAACSSPAGTPDAPAAPWTLGPELPGPRLEPGVATLGLRLVIAGGFDTNLAAGLHITTQVHQLVLEDDPTKSVWQPMLDAPVAWTHLNLVGVGTTLYLLGGLEGTLYRAHGEAYALDDGATAWRSLAPLPLGQERGAAGIVVSPPHVYLIGGASTTSALATCLDYDVSTDTWTMLPDLPAPLSHPAAMRRADGTLVVAGGLATLDASQPTGQVLVLPPQATAWEVRTPMHFGRGGCAYGVVRGQLVCAAGEAGQAALQLVESYDPIGDVWTDAPAMPVARAGTQAGVIAGRLLVPGGAQELRFEPTSTLYIFTPQDTAAAPNLGGL